MTHTHCELWLSVPVVKIHPLRVVYKCANYRRSHLLWVVSVPVMSHPLHVVRVSVVMSHQPRVMSVPVVMSHPPRVVCVPIVMSHQPRVVKSASCYVIPTASCRCACCNVTPTASCEECIVIYNSSNWLIRKAKKKYIFFCMLIYCCISCMKFTIWEFITLIKGSFESSSGIDRSKDAKVIYAPKIGVNSKLIYM